MDNLAIAFTDITDNEPMDLAGAFDQANAVEVGNPLIELEEEAMAAFEQAVSDIKAIRRQAVTQLAISMGKDSTLLLLAGLAAHEQLIAEGDLAQDAPFVVSTIDTMVENHMMTILVREEVKRLATYCNVKNINFDMRFASPPLHMQWGALFVSGKKLLSNARLNNDCSSDMKVTQSERVEREIQAQYGDVIICVGSRLDESAKRAESLNKRNQANRDVYEFLDNVSNKREDNVFAPISNMSTEQVWLLLRRAGTHPIVTPTTPNYVVPSYADNHLLLSIIYGDSTDGTCPTTSKKVKGQSAGGCGKNARTGCSLCLKVFKDSSGEAQNTLPRHNAISGNMLKIRNYLAYVAEDMSKRTWHTRAIDHTTGAIAAYPNVLNAETLDTIMHLLIQATADEVVRAKQFKQLVSVGDEHLDIGYRDILDDASMSVREKALFAEVYKQHAQAPLHAPMSLEICLYLSFIHARDGVKLPSYRAVALWERLYTQFLSDVEEARYVSDGVYRSLSEAHKHVVEDYEQRGLRIPYPDVNVEDAPREDPPDAVMIMPDTALADFAYVPHTGMFTADDVVDCMIGIEHQTVKLPFSQAKMFLPEDITVSASTVSLRGFTLDKSLRTFKDTTKYVPAKREYSKRAIKKASRKNGQFKVLERNRTSVGSFSFSVRTDETVFSERVSTPVAIPKLQLNTHYVPLNEPDDDTTGTYAISEEGYYNWLDYGGFERAMEAHDKAVENRQSRGESIYHWMGVHVVEEMQRYGLFNLSPAAIKSSMFNLRRTAYFGQMGLFRLSDEAFIELAATGSTTAQHDLSELYPDLYVNAVMPMKAYRTFKAKKLMAIRAERNANRRSIKHLRERFIASPISVDVELAKEYVQTLLTDFQAQIYDFNNGYLNSHYGKDAIEAYAKFLSSLLGNINHFKRLLSNTSKREIKRALADKKRIDNVRKTLYHDLKALDGIGRFSIEWQPFVRDKVSLTQKPVEAAVKMIW